MKNSYIAISVEENNKYYAYILKVSNSENLIEKLKIKGILHANICKNKKEAENIVAVWNDAYKANNTYMFSATF